MKTAISVPDRLFKAADRAARKLGVSRSELYARAVSAYLKALEDQDVTSKLDGVYAGRKGDADPDVVKIQLATLTREKW